MPWEKYAQTSDAAGPWAKYAAPAAAAPKAAPAEKASEPTFLNTLGREAQSAAGAIAGIPGGIYHAFADKPTEEEIREAGGPEQVQGAKRIGLGIGRIAVEPVLHAADWYTKAAQGKIPNAYEQALSVAPEAVGTGAGTAVGGKLIEEIPGAAGKVIEKAPPVVRAAARGANKALATYPKAIGSTVGGAIGAATRIPYGTEVGMGIGAAVGPEILPKIRVPGEGFGLPSRVTGGPAVAPQFEPGAPIPATPAEAAAPSAAPPVETAAPTAKPSSFTPSGRIKPAVAKQLQSQIEQGLGNEQPAATQPIAQAAAATAPELPADFTATPKSSALRGYKYDPAAREFEYITTDGQHYVRGDVAPEAASQFEKTAAEKDSFGKAWHELRNNPQGGVGQFKVLNGKRVPVIKTGPVTDLAAQIKDSAEPSQAPVGKTLGDVPKAIKQSLKASAKPAAIRKAAPQGELASQLNQMADRVKSGQSLKDITASAAEDAYPVKITYDEHGIPTSATDGRHRVIQAIEHGTQRIPVLVDRGNGPIPTTVDPKVLAREMGVTKESLEATDEQQSYRAGNRQPRPMKIRKQ